MFLICVCISASASDLMMEHRTLSTQHRHRSSDLGPVLLRDVILCQQINLVSFLFRGGSFKGLDLTFGDTGAYGGMLIRGIELADGALVSGPCLCVDYLIRQLGFTSVAELHGATVGRHAVQDNGLLTLLESNSACERPIFNTPRVGLSLKRASDAHSPLIPYVMRRYRFLTRPEANTKGRPQLILALHIDGHSVRAIRQSVRLPTRTIEGYIRDFEAGRATSSLDSFLQIPMNTRNLCRLYGHWYEHQRCRA